MEHSFRFADEPLCFCDAGPQGCLVRFDLAGLLFTPLGAFRFVSHLVETFGSAPLLQDLSSLRGVSFRPIADSREIST